MELESQKERHARLLGAMVALGRAVEGNVNKPGVRAHNALLSAMYLMIPGRRIAEQQMNAVLRQLRTAKKILVPRCLHCENQCGRNDEFSVLELRKLDQDIVSAKEALLMEILSFEPLLRGMRSDELRQEILDGLYAALFYFGKECSRTELISVLQTLYNIKGRLLETKIDIDN